MCIYLLAFFFFFGILFSFSSVFLFYFKNSLFIFSFVYLTSLYFQTSILNTINSKDFVFFNKGKKILDASKNLAMGRVKGIAERICPNDIRKSLVTGYDVHPDIQSYKKDG